MTPTTIAVMLPIDIQRDRANGVFVATSPVVPGLIVCAKISSDLSHKITLKLAEMAEPKKVDAA